ncbi:hypothetical protein HPE42_20945 [Escherichia coli]|nr:hypothetical protein HPE42_20945 [Escherichia coli]
MNLRNHAHASHEDKELVAAAHAAAVKLPPAEASLMREVATRPDVTFAALTESMDQRMSLDAEINHLRQESVQ